MRIQLSSIKSKIKALVNEKNNIIVYIKIKSTQLCSIQFISTRKPTYWPTNLNKLFDLIDLYLIKGISSYYTEVEDLIKLTSDHIPVLLSLSLNVIMK